MKFSPSMATHGLAPFSSMARAALRRLMRAVLVVAAIVLAGTAWEARAVEPSEPVAIATPSIQADCVRAVERDRRNPA
jgi:hypothetical protein